METFHLRVGQSTKERDMIKRLMLMAAVTMLEIMPAITFAHETEPGSPAVPPGGEFYANDALYESVVTPAHVPYRGPFDAFYTFPDCATCVPVSDPGIGDTNYNGGRWAVMEAFGITSQLTNAADVLAAATSVADTGHRFVCPLIKKAG